jgi:hypothetical protein
MVLALWQRIADDEAGEAAKRDAKQRSALG